VGSSAGSVNKPVSTLKLTPAAIAERRKIGQCFHCSDMYTNGHREVCKQLFVIEVLVDDDHRALAAETEDLAISLHALMGIHPWSGHTMQLIVDINGTRHNALLDSGSTHNFVDLDAAEHAGIITLANQTGLNVAVANGD
jgi:predicted aspartyl protease